MLAGHGGLRNKSAARLCGVTRRTAADYAARYWLAPVPLH